MEENNYDKGRKGRIFKFLVLSDLDDEEKVVAEAEMRYYYKC